MAIPPFDDVLGGIKCPKCGELLCRDMSEMAYCPEEIEMFQGQVSVLCSQPYCGNPHCDWIGSENGKCPHNKPDCPCLPRTE